MPPLYENYKDYQAPRFVQGTMASLISWLLEQYLSGLQSVVLTNSKALGKGKTRRVRGRKHKLDTCLGFYHPQRTREAPWIEIVVDNIIAGTPRVLCWLPFVRKLAFASTLFHEVGHHLDYTIGAPARSGEAAAEAWSKRLFRAYVFEHYGWHPSILTRCSLAGFHTANDRTEAEQDSLGERDHAGACRRHGPGPMRLPAKVFEAMIVVTALVVAMIEDSLAYWTNAHYQGRRPISGHPDTVGVVSGGGVRPNAWWSSAGVGRDVS